MEQNENMVQDENFESEDLLMEEIVEEPQDDSLSLEEALGEQPVQEQNGNQKTQSAGEPKEPGYVQNRINKAVEKAVSAVRNEYEAKLAPLMEHMLNTEAQELVRSGKVKDLETAKELVRYRQGQPQAAEPQQPRNERGQFASAQNSVDPATQARISMLQHQADRIKAQGGPDVISAFQNDPEIKEKLVSGEWDFYDVADSISKTRKKTPAPMRSPNGASSNPRAIDFENMSSEQFKKLEKRIQEEGVRISLR